MHCKICGKESTCVFKHVILEKFEIEYFYCANCDFLFTEDPYWIKEAYSSPINLSDTGIISRNISLSFTVTNIIFYLFNKNLTYLDFAGGYGILTRIMRDIGLNFKWQDNYTNNLLARGFEYDKNDTIELVTAFEVFEHFINPILEIEKILNISKNILFSTEIKKESTPNQDWWYYGFNHGQHISFFSKKTIQFIADKYNLNYYTNNHNIHLLTRKKINKLFFKLITNKKTGFIFYIFARILLKSKTWSDHIKMKAFKKDN